METFERTIDVECVGENTRQKYVGQFQVKLFLSNSEHLELDRELRQKVGDISTIAASWNLKGYVESIKGLKNQDGETPIQINDNAKNLILAYINHFLPSIPTSANVVSNCVILNKHIISSPEWWTKSKNGIDLYDHEPINELLKQLRLLKDNFLNEDQDKT